MSRFFRKARALLSAYEEFPKVEVSAIVFLKAQTSLLSNAGAEQLVKEQRAVANARATNSIAASNSPSCAGFDSLLSTLENSNFTGTADFALHYDDGRLLMNCAFATICHGTDGPLFEAVAHFAGRGIAESSNLASADEMSLSQNGAFKTIWTATLLNLIPSPKWRNERVEVVNDPAGRFNSYRCRDAIQETWDALTALLLLEQGSNLPAVHTEVVTLDQVAPLTGLSKRTLERYLKNAELPEPDSPGGGGRAHKWYWDSIKRDLAKVCGRQLPERFPGSRIL